MEGANRQYRKVTGPAAEVKEGFVYSAEMSATGVALAAGTKICSAQSELWVLGRAGHNIRSMAEVVCSILPFWDQL